MNRSKSVLKYSFLIALFLLTIFPVIYVFFSSFKTNMEVLTGGPKLFPEKFILDNYRQAWELANFKRYFWNSIYMSFFIVVGSIIATTITGYVFARGNFPGKKLIFGIMISTMFISVASLFLYPQLQVAKFLGLNNSLWGVILIRVFAMNIAQVFIARAYISSLPYEIDEAAKIDGCSFFRRYWSIILPISKPLIATIGLLSFRTAWNDYLLPLIFTLASPDNQPLIVGVVNLKSTGEAASSWNLMLAGTSMSIIPIIIVYLILNKYFIYGLTSGSVKQ